MQKNGKAIGGFVCSILAIVFMELALIPFVGLVPFVLSIVGVCLSNRGIKDSQHAGTGHGLAVAGLVIGIIALVISGIATACYSCAIAAAASGAGASV